jgi:hypothetical protein
LQQIRIELGATVEAVQTELNNSEAKSRTAHPAGKRRAA